MCNLLSLTSRTKCEFPIYMSTCLYFRVNNQKHMKLMSENESLVRELELAREKIADMTRELEASQAIIEVRLRYIVLFGNLIVTELLSVWGSGLMFKSSGSENEQCPHCCFNAGLW